MGKLVQVPEETLQCLRGHLTGAFEIFQNLGIEIGSAASERSAPVSKPKKPVTHKDRVDKYKNMLASGKRGKKPDNLK